MHFRVDVNLQGLLGVYPDQVFIHGDTLYPGGCVARMFCCGGITFDTLPGCFAADEFACEELLRDALCRSCYIAKVSFPSS